MRQVLSLIAFVLATSSSGLAQARVDARWASHLPDPEPKFRVAPSEVSYWLGKPVYSADSKKIGEITNFKRDADNGVTELFYESGGFLGLGAKHYEITARQIRQVRGDRVVLTLKKTEAEGLPQRKMLPRG